MCTQLHEADSFVSRYFAAQLLRQSRVRRLAPVRPADVTDAKREAMQQHGRSLAPFWMSGSHVVACMWQRHIQDISQMTDGQEHFVPAQISTLTLMIFNVKLFSIVVALCL